MVRHFVTNNRVPYDTAVFFVDKSIDIFTNHTKIYLFVKLLNPHIEPVLINFSRYRKINFYS